MARHGISYIWKGLGQELPGMTGYSRLFSVTAHLSCILKTSATVTLPLLSTLLSVLLSYLYILAKAGNQSLLLQS